ncbi:MULTISPECIES: ABC transporter permease [Vibrio]|uniref:ABC transporter permease subunit n=2 Tax=Vibrio TaxID=662 RepID=A0A7X4RU28_9VIBR|nr:MULTISPECIES: ABC transporter permease [Vibrio]MBF9002366.1 ABC transporter permease [Vibrio nitrifigilis]MZI93053.1 ABC transporter permease subunit [Vibrio eleionomae]
MKSYIIKKLFAFPFILIGVSLVVFIAIRSLPGDPARLMAGNQATPEAVQDMRVRLGLEQPLPVQYIKFVEGAVQGDFGHSLKSKQPVLSEISERLPYTLILALLAYIVAIVVGVPAGMLGAVYQHRAIDQIVMILAITGASVANFWLALLAMNYFSVELHWLPLLGATSWKSYILPTLTLAIFPMAVVARMTRSGVIDVLSADYIRTAKAKGLSPVRIYWLHAFRNALVPIVTIIALNFGSLIGGAVVTESLFNWPGIGRLLVDSVRYRDYPVIEGVTLVAVSGVVLMNLLGEVVIGFLNPKIRFN